MPVPAKPALLAVVLSAGLAGAAAAQPYPPPSYAAPYAAVPPPRVEVVPDAPGTRYIWEPGHWHWDARQYVWIAGHYIVQRPEYARYVPGRWAARDGAWVWVPAHWR